MNALPKTSRPIRAVIFDMDGTVARPIFDFKKMRRDLGCPDGVSIVEYIEALETGERAKAVAYVEAIEAENAEKAERNHGVEELFHFLEASGIRRGLLTRNTEEAMQVTLAKLDVRFDATLTRDEPPIKPHPDSARKLAERLGAPPEEILVVGDYLYDVQVGEAIGARTALITNHNVPEFEAHPDFTINRLDELIDIIRDINNAA